MSEQISYIDRERLAFEAWFTPRMDMYLYTHAWPAWQARAALQNEQVAELVAALKELRYGCTDKGH